jgi:hypothetical protein
MSSLNSKRYYKHVYKCNPPKARGVDGRNKILVSAVEVARGPASREQKRAVEGMNVWKRVNDQIGPQSDDDDDMEVDE